MEPVLLICGGCGVRIRATDPARVRDRACPRCEMSLGPAVDRALNAIAPVESIALLPSPAVAPSGPRSLSKVGLATLSVLVVAGGLAAFFLGGSSPGSSHDAGTKRPVVALRNDFETNPTAELASVEVDVDDRPPAQPSPAELTPPPPLGHRDLAIRTQDHRNDVVFPPTLTDNPSRSTSLDSPPPPLPSPTINPTSPEPRRLVVRDRKGRAIVAREHGMVKGRLFAMLPDGQLGLPAAEVLTKDPFVPSTMEQMRRSLLDDPEFATFRLHQTAHYLILYQSKTDTFARASGDLLEKLHDGLTVTLTKKFGLPVQPMEFPLVAVIFETEAQFRANRPVPPEVQAFYDTLSNRIFFYEKSKRDQDSPEIAALRKPQTVAHEGTHQILHNVGIQPRMSDWPLWLVEGLAEYCSPAKITRKGVDWAGLGQVNPLHMATIRDLDDPTPNQFQVGGRQTIGARDRRTPMVEYLVTRKDLTPTDYALAWALTHYLADRKTDDFATYLQRMNRLKPGVEQSPADQLAAFRDVFGNDLVQMDAKVAAHLKKINVKTPDPLPFYAVIFEQQVGAMVRRQAMVSQSPSVIRQWLESVSLPQGGEPHWEFFPQPSRKQAIAVVDQWMKQGH